MPRVAAQQPLGGCIWNGSTAQASTRGRVTIRAVLAAPALARIRAFKVLRPADPRRWKAIPISARPNQSVEAAPVAEKIWIIVSGQNGGHSVDDCRQTDRRGKRHPDKTDRVEIRLEKDR